MLGSGKLEQRMMCLRMSGRYGTAFSCMCTWPSSEMNEWQRLFLMATENIFLVSKNVIQAKTSKQANKNWIKTIKTSLLLIVKLCVEIPQINSAVMKVIFSISFLRAPVCFLLNFKSVCHSLYFPVIPRRVRGSHSFKLIEFQHQTAPKTVSQKSPIDPW